MFNSGSGSLVRTGRIPVLVLVLVVAAILSGCSSKQEQALDQAKKQAAATGQAQQVVSVDKDGTTTTTVVQPPATGQTSGEITTTVTPPTAGAPVPAPSGPTVSAVPQPVSVSIPAGTMLTIRIDQRISVKTSRAGDTFTGEVVDPVLAGDNSVLVPKGALVGGVVDVAHRRGHFKGRSLLELRLTSLTSVSYTHLAQAHPTLRAGWGLRARRAIASPGRRCNPRSAERRGWLLLPACLLYTSPRRWTSMIGRCLVQCAPICSK